jgi:protein-S-isoprenylcysteine O-methyltransferase Ste14
MSTPEASDGKPARRTRSSRRVALLLGLLVVLLVYPLMVGVLPWALSLLTPRLGWTESGPGIWNLLGLIPVVAGLAGLVWVFGVMFAQLPKLPETAELDAGERLWSATSRILITHGPFAFSRNPMFLAGLIVLLGWALFYGSVVILLVAIAGWVMAHSLKVPREERGLEAHFGEAYRVYQARVPRWLGLPRR